MIANYRGHRKSTKRATVAMLAGVMACTLAACGDTSLKATAPAVVVGAKGPPDLPELPPSVVDAPISYELADAKLALEQAVPDRFGDIGKRVINPSNDRQQFAFAATRTPFRISMKEQELTVSTTVEYQGRGWFNPKIGPTVSAGCGQDSIKPRVRVSIVSSLDLTPEWKVKTRSRVGKVEPFSEDDRDACRVTLFKIDVTDKVLNAIRGQLESRLPKVDASLARFDVHTRLERWYNLLNKSIKVGDSLWLQVNPGAVRFGGLRANDTSLIADVRLYAQPAIISGPKPPKPFTPLPPLERARMTVGDSARMMVEGTLGYEVASALLEKQLVGKSFRRYGRKVSIVKARLYGLGDGRIALGLQFAGTLVGEGYLVGTPKFDAASNMLYVPDLNFDVATSDALVQGVAWLKKENVIDQLRKLARLSLTDVIEQGRTKVEKSINRELTRGVQLTAQLKAGRVIDVVALERALIVRGEAVGSLGLSVDREIPNVKKNMQKARAKQAQ